LKNIQRFSLKGVDTERENLEKNAIHSKSVSLYRSKYYTAFNIQIVGIVFIDAPFCGKKRPVQQRHLLAPAGTLGGTFKNKNETWIHRNKHRSIVFRKLHLGSFESKRIQRSVQPQTASGATSCGLRSREFLTPNASSDRDQLKSENVELFNSYRLTHVSW
jgi:hypothetical protein